MCVLAHAMGAIPVSYVYLHARTHTHTHTHQHTHTHTVCLWCGSLGHRYDTTIDSLLVTDSSAGRREEGDAPGESGWGLGVFSDKMEPPMTMAVLPAETRSCCV